MSTGIKCIIFSETIYSHIVDLRHVIGRLQEQYLHLGSKFSFGISSLALSEGITPSTEITLAIADCPNNKRTQIIFEPCQSLPSLYSCYSWSTY